ncbi:MAG: hypothetical protein WD490_05720 [Opitutales bacterium]
MKALFITFLLFLPFGLHADTDEVMYSDVFHKHYPVQGREFDLTHDDLETPNVVWDDLRQRKITVLRTRGDKYPYEEQKCVIIIEGSGLETPRILSATHFRTVEVSWITGKLILLRIGIGHVAAVEAIYDTEKESWVYRESIHYVKKVPGN